MVGEVVAECGHVKDERHVRSLQDSGRVDTGEPRELRALQCASAQDHFVIARGDFQLVIDPKSNYPRALFVQFDALDQGAGDHFQIRPGHGRLQEHPAGGCAASALVNGCLRIADPLSISGIDVGK